MVFTWVLFLIWRSCGIPFCCGCGSPSDGVEAMNEDKFFIIMMTVIISVMMISGACMAIWGR